MCSSHLEAALKWALSIPLLLLLLLLNLGRQLAELACISQTLLVFWSSSVKPIRLQPSNESSGERRRGSRILKSDFSLATSSAAAADGMLRLSDASKRELTVTPRYIIQARYAYNQATQSQSAALFIRLHLWAKWSPSCRRCLLKAPRLLILARESSAGSRAI